MGTKLRLSSDFVGRGFRAKDIRDKRTMYLREQRKSLAATYEESEEKKEHRRQMFILFGGFVLSFTLLMYFFG